MLYKNNRETKLNKLLLFINIIMFTMSYDTSLLKPNYFYDGSNLFYINAMNNSKGDLYIEYYGTNTGNRYIFGLNSTTGEEIYWDDNNNIKKFTSNFQHTYHNSIIININDQEHYIFSLSPYNCEFINLKEESISTKSTYAIFPDDSEKSNPSIKNNIIKLKNNLYITSILLYKNILGIKNKFLIFNFNTANINGLNKISQISESIAYIKTTDCFQTEKEYIECLFTRLLHYGSFDIAIFDQNLERKDDQEIAKIEDYTFIKIFHIKKEIGAYVYFNSKTNQPNIEIKELNLNSKPILKNKFSSNPITLNNNEQYSLSNELFLSDAIKINEFRFSIILTRNDLTNIVICLFDIYKDDTSIKLRYFNLDLSNKNIKISQNINAFLFRDNLGLGFYNENSGYPGYLIFGYPNITSTNEIILNSDITEYVFSLKDNIELSNNIFGNKVIKLKINSFSEITLSGITLSSFDENRQLSYNDELDINDKIIFREDSEGRKIGRFPLELIPIIQEPNYEEFESLANNKYYFGEDQTSYYQPKTINAKIIIIYYIVEDSCPLAYHKNKRTGLKVCYENDFCYLHQFKYYLDDKKECSSSKCPIDYYQFNFQCFHQNCPDNTIPSTINSINICKSIYDYCIVNEHFQTICNNTKFNEYIYQFDNTNQYLKSCPESLIYTTNEVQTYLFNNVCYIDCPENTIKNDVEGKCVCKYYKYEENNFVKCYLENEICEDKIPVIDIKECVNSINDCITKDYKIFNNECYKNGCPKDTIKNENSPYCKYNGLFYKDTLNNKTIYLPNSEYCPKNYPYVKVLTNECISNCSVDELMDETVKINNIFNSIDNITNNIKNIIYDDKYFIEDEIIAGKNIAYEVFNSKNNKYQENLSYLDFEECEKKLLQEYGIEYLYVLKIDIRINNTDPTIVNIQAFDPDNKNELDLSKCGNINIELPSYLDLDTINDYIKAQERDYDILNINDPFYRDICTPFTSEYNTDISLEDRKERYFKEKEFLNLCQDGCEYKSYDLDTKRIKCECTIKNETQNLTEIITFDKNNLKKFFYFCIKML